MATASSVLSTFRRSNGVRVSDTHRYKDNRIALLFMAPWIIGFIFFTLETIIASLYLSFTHYEFADSAGMGRVGELPTAPFSRSALRGSGRRHGDVRFLGSAAAFDLRVGSRHGSQTWHSRSAAVPRSLLPTLAARRKRRNCDFVAGNLWW